MINSTIKVIEITSTVHLILSVNEKPSDKGTYFLKIIKGHNKMFAPGYVWHKFPLETDLVLNSCDFRQYPTSYNCRVIVSNSYCLLARVIHRNFYIILLYTIAYILKTTVECSLICKHYNILLFNYRHGIPKIKKEIKLPGLI